MNIQEVSTNIQISDIVKLDKEQVFPERTMQIIVKYYLSGCLSLHFINSINGLDNSTTKISK